MNTSYKQYYNILAYLSRCAGSREPYLANPEDICDVCFLLYGICEQRLSHSTIVNELAALYV